MNRAFLLLFLSLSRLFPCMAQVNSGFPRVPLVALSGDTINSTSLLEDGRRSFVCFFATWCPPSVREFDYLYEKGVIDLCNRYNIKKILLTDKSLPFQFNGSKPKGNWPNKLSEDFIICIDGSFSVLESVKGEKSFPFGCIVETDSIISYCYSGFSEDKIDTLIKKLSSPQFTICKNCNGSGINPKACSVCKGTGRCMICYYDPDYYLHHCNSCDNSRICSVCHNLENKRKQCTKCFGTGNK